MPDGPFHEGHPPVLAASAPVMRRRARLAIALVVASGVTITGACTTPTSPSPGDAEPPGASAPVAPTTPAPTTAPPPTAAPTPAPTTTAPSATAAPDPQTGPQPGSQPGSQPDAAAQTLRIGATGEAVREIQERLTDLGYWLGAADDHYGQLTRQAVMAFQKTEGLTRDGIAGPRTRELLPKASRPEARDTSGDHIEVDLDHQVLMVVSDGEVRWAFNTSTGNGESYDRPSGGTGVAATPRGEFEIERHIDGIRKAELGDLYRPKYFRGGVAVHGSGSIPARPASHGCVRVTNSVMDLLWSSDLAEIGTPVVVY